MLKAVVELRVAISRIALLLRVSVVMAAENVGVCVPTGVLCLILCKSFECTEHQSTHQLDPAQLTVLLLTF